MLTSDNYQLSNVTIRPANSHVVRCVQCGQDGARLDFIDVGQIVQIGRIVRLDVAYAKNMGRIAIRNSQQLVQIVQYGLSN